MQFRRQFSPQEDLEQIVDECEPELYAQFPID